MSDDLQLHRTRKDIRREARAVSLSPATPQEVQLAKVRSTLSHIAIYLALLILGILTIIPVAYASHDHWTHPKPVPVNKQLQHENETLKQQLCVAVKGNWSTPNGQPGRCITR